MNIQERIIQRDRAIQAALNFVGHEISSSDGSYELLIEVIFDVMSEAGKTEGEACAKIADARGCYEIADKMRARSG